MGTEIHPSQCPHCADEIVLELNYDPEKDGLDYFTLTHGEDIVDTNLPIERTEEWAKLRAGLQEEAQAATPFWTATIKHRGKEQHVPVWSVDYWKAFQEIYSRYQGCAVVQMKENVKAEENK